ncbi:MAG: S-layer homology domain-containing protein [Slackia sp.]|nr:S-layer homology domain-containing protein [Slackia sp.]
MEQKKIAGRGMAVLLSAALVPAIGVPTAAFAADTDASQAASQEAYERGNVVDEMLAQEGADGSLPYDADAPASPFVVGETSFDSLQAAVDAIAAGTVSDSVVRLVDNAAGNGLVVKSGTDFTFDLGGFTYTIDGSTVGSAGTETNGFQLLQGSNIVIKNGAITSDKAKILIQNYSNLTLEGVDLTGGAQTQYTLSNNNGNVVIGKGTNIVAGQASPQAAFDVCGFADYKAVDVTIAEDAGVIEGNIELYSGNDAKLSLHINGGDLSKAKFVAAHGAEKVSVDKAPGVSLAAPEGHQWANNVLTPVGEKVELAMADGSAAFCASLADAVKVARDGDTVKLLQDIELTEIVIVDGKSLALDLNGKTITNTKNIYAGRNVSLISLRGGSELVVSGGGTMKAKANDCYALDVSGGSKLTINDGVFVGNISAVYLDGKADLVVNGGEFSIRQLSTTGKDYRFMLNCSDNDYKSGDATITVNGGTFHGFNPGDNLAEGQGTSFLGKDAVVTVDEQAVPPVYTVETKYVPPVIPPSKPDADVDIEQKPDGSTVTTETRPDGSQTVTTEAADGTESVVEKDAEGNVESVEVTVSKEAAESGEVVLPVEPSKPAADASEAPVVEVKVPAQAAGGAPVKVTVPVAEGPEGELPAGVVVMARGADGAWRPLPKTGIVDGGVAVALAGDAGLKVVDASADFPDTAGAWYGEDGTADFVSARGILEGVPQADGTLRFDGDARATRAMFVTMLHRLESEPEAFADLGFDDVTGSEWFADAASWGVENKIVHGYGDGSVFGGDDAVTREQMAVFMMRYAEAFGLDTSARADLSGFSDADEVLPYAREAVAWAVAEGLIAGHADGTGRLAPADGATRAEVSAVIMRLVNGMYA